MDFKNIVSNIGKIITKDNPDLEFIPIVTSYSNGIVIKRGEVLIDISGILLENVMPTIKGDIKIPSINSNNCYEIVSNHYGTVFIDSGTYPNRLKSIGGDSRICDAIYLFFSMIHSYVDYWECEDDIENNGHAINPYAHGQGSKFYMRNDRGHIKTFDTCDVTNVTYDNKTKGVYIYFKQGLIWIGDDKMQISTTDSFSNIYRDNPYYNHVAYFLKLFGRRLQLDNSKNPFLQMRNSKNGFH